MPPKRHEEEEHEEHENHEAWVIPYADMLTLLMAMFLMLYAVGTIDAKKFQALAGAFRSEIAGESRVVDPGISQNSAEGAGVLTGSSTAWPISSLVGALTGRDARVAGANALATQEAAAAAQTAEVERLEQVADTLEGQVEAAGLGGSVEFHRNERGLSIIVLSDGVLFGAGSSGLAAPSIGLLATLASTLEPLDNTIEIVGHTDSTPISTAQFPSNWELSTARAGSVVRYFIDQLGFPPERLRSSGLADTRPLAPNDSAESRARNRRVEITVLAETTTTALPTETAAAPSAGGDDHPTTDPAPHVAGH